ncbi:hypothetical protein HDR62_06925 [bacterium]|nr:hypothetical protein [bacterium]
MRLKTTLLAAVGCLMLVPSCKDPEEKTVYATNKAGERLVEKIIAYSTDTVYFKYNSDGTLKTIKGFEGENRILSFERKGNTLFMQDKEDDYIEESSFDLNEKGWIVLDRGWGGFSNFRFTYDDNGYLHNVFKGEELLWTFEWKDGNIANEEVTYIPTQSNPSNIDWCAFFQSWRHVETYDNTENLVDVASICLFWGFSEGYLGNKCKGLPLTKNNGRTNYSYDFDQDGFVSTIYINGAPRYKVSYLKR